MGEGERVFRAASISARSSERDEINRRRARGEIPGRSRSTPSTPVVRHWLSGFIGWLAAKNGLLPRENPERNLPFEVFFPLVEAVPGGGRCRLRTADPVRRFVSPRNRRDPKRSDGGVEYWCFEHSNTPLLHHSESLIFPRVKMSEAY